MAKCGIAVFSEREAHFIMEIVLAKAATMIAIILLGYILKNVGFLDSSYFPMLSKLMINITLPCVIIGKFSEFTVSGAFLIFALIGIVLNLLTIAVGIIAGLRGGRKSQAYYMINLSGFNIGAFTLPFVQNFLGAEGVVATCVFDTGNSIMCTGVTYALASSVAAEGERQSVKSFCKKLFTSMPMDTYVVMLLLSLAGIRLPEIVTSFTTTVGNANTFLAMLVIGIGFEWRLKKEQVIAVGETLLFRYAFSAVAAFLFYRFLPFSQEVRQAMVFVAFAPLSALCPVYTERCGGDESLSSTLNSLSILISTLCITLLLIFFSV